MGNYRINSDNQFPSVSNEHLLHLFRDSRHARMAIADNGESFLDGVGGQAELSGAGNGRS